MGEENLELDTQFMHAEKGHVKILAEIGMMDLSAKACQGFLAITRS